MKISIIGTGLFGFSIARYLGKNHLKNESISITTYDINKKLIDHLKKNKSHLYHFKDKKLPDNISFTSDKKEISKNADIIIMAVQSQATREVIREIKDYLKNDVVILNTAKA